MRKAGRWKAGLGSILEAYYRLEDARAVLSDLAGLEEGASGAARAYDSAARAAERAEAGREAFAAYSGALQARSDRARIIKRWRRTSAATAPRWTAGRSLRGSWPPPAR